MKVFPGGTRSLQGVLSLPQGNRPIRPPKGGVHPGVILIRCPNHLTGLLLIQMESHCTLSCHWMFTPHSSVNQEFCRLVQLPPPEMLEVQLTQASLDLLNTTQLAKHNSTYGLPLQPHTPTRVHHFSSHTPKSTLHGGFNVQVTCLVSHTIRWISEDLTANTPTARDLSHSDTAASQRGIFLLSRQSTVEEPGLQGLSEPPAVCIDDRISDISLPARESRK